MGSEATTLTGPPGATSSANALLLVAGEGFISTYELPDRELIIGRGDDADIRVDHPALSRRHAAVRGGASVSVRDLDSTNGTLIAGALRRGGAAMPLAMTDVFRIGPFTFALLGRGVTDERSLSLRDVFRVVDPTPAGVPAAVRNIAASAASVMILGETGVGKEVLAETIHGLSGRTGAFTRINCAALSETLLESELFGHERGAFTGAVTAKLGLLESAQGGTVFLDELGEMPLTTQAKLLRAVEHREVVRLGAVRPTRIDVRFVAATNRDLPAEVEAGRFRRDLFFRLDGVTFVIPPLRERRGRIGALALMFLRAAAGPGGRTPRLAGDVLAALEAHTWPGNVRELKAVMERALLLARDGEIGARHLAFARRAPEEPPAPAPAPARDPDPVPLDFLDDEQRADRARVLAALDECAGNQTRAAKKLGIGRTLMLQKLRLYRIPRPRA